MTINLNSANFIGISIAVRINLAKNLICCHIDVVVTKAINLLPPFLQLLIAMICCKEKKIKHETSRKDFLTSAFPLPTQ